jgi:hypothetical protein
MTHRVLLVREWDAQHTGSGCCGKLGGVGTELCDPGDFARTRAEMVRVGAVYEALHAAFARDEVELTVVDPRNTAWMIPTVYRDARRRGYSRLEALRQVARSSANGAVVVDGRVVFDGRIPPSPSEAVAAVRAEVAGAAGPRP